MNSPSDKLAKLEAQRAALDLKIRAEVRQERERRRREDTRAKIIVGGAFIALLRSEPIMARALAPKLLPFVAKSDQAQVKALFANALGLSVSVD